MVRFYYKADVQQKAKILRKVTFPATLDAHEFCSPELQRALAAPRAAAQEAADRAALAGKAAAADGLSAEEARAREDAEPAVAASGPSASAAPLTGRYELCGVLTHKGRSADSGHYVAWVKQDDGSWVLFDDDRVEVRKEEDVLALAGGGDWHMAYLLLYRAERAPAVGPPRPGHASGEHGQALPDEPAAQA